MAPIQTYVFFDLGTTGLNEENNDKITELSMIAVSRGHLLNVNAGVPRPRVQHKLVMCFNPEKKIGYSAKRDGTGGFNNEVLQNQNPFNMTSGETIANFLDTLTAPVCLVAHNGDAFDYAIFRRYLSNSPVGLRERFRSIMCVDSMLVFITLERNQGNNQHLNGPNPNKLTNVYKRVMNNEPYDSHKAEADCYLMMEIAATFSGRFVQEVDRVHRPLYPF